MPDARRLDRDSALAELARRYFTSHGPATLQDFSWWSGLTKADAEAGRDLAARDLSKEVLEGRTYWFSSSSRARREPSAAAHLLPAFDEYTVGYKDRTELLEPSQRERRDVTESILGPVIVLEGRVVGSWRRALTKRSVVVTARPFTPLEKPEKDAVAAAARRYGAFLGLPVEYA